jgi:hypothetical protein
MCILRSSKSRLLQSRNLFDRFAIEKEVATVLIKAMAHWAKGVQLCYSPFDVYSHWMAVMRQPPHEHLDFVGDI